MVSLNAQKGIDGIFVKAALASLALRPEVSCQVEALDNFSAAKIGSFVVFTISAPTFKCLTFFHINEDKAVQEFFCPKKTEQQGTGENSGFLDSFLEFGNICCGAVNRELLRHYPNLGMSTPYVLRDKSFEFMSFLQPGHIRHFNIRINAAVGFMATVCLCDYHDLDFTVEPGTEVEECGALEFF